MRPDGTEHSDTILKAHDESVSSSAGAADGQTLSGFYKTYAPELSGYLRKAFGDGPPDPEDVTQEAFRRLAEKGDLGAIENFKAFLWRTARNLVLTERRKTDMRSQADFEVSQLFFAVKGTEFTPERVLEVEQQLRIINAALGKMPERRRKAFLLHRVDGLNLAAVGRQLGVSRRAAVKHVMRAIVDIDVALEEGQSA